AGMLPRWPLIIERLTRMTWAQSEAIPHGRGSSSGRWSHPFCYWLLALGQAPSQETSTSPWRPATSNVVPTYLSLSWRGLLHLRRPGRWLKIGFATKSFGRASEWPPQRKGSPRPSNETSRPSLPSAAHEVTSIRRSVSRKKLAREIAKLD